MEKPTVCLDDVRWREPDDVPTQEAWHVNQSCPQVGDIRWVLIGNEAESKIPTGESGWMLFQPGASHYNGWENAEEIEASAVIQVTVLEQEKPPRKVAYKQVSWWAKVVCLKVVPIDEIANTFPESQPSILPRDGEQVQIFDWSNLIFYWILTQECTEWFVVTKTNPPRLILRCEQILDYGEPIEICNCVFEVEKWPHKVHRSRR